MKAVRTFKYETHLHTSEASACGAASGAEMALAYHRAGYDGIIVTDHFFNGSTAIPHDLPWEDRVAWFYTGYEHAHDAGASVGLQVFCGWEYTHCGMDFLTYGLGKDFLLAHPDILAWPIEEYFDTVHRRGGFIVHAHPFRDRDYIKEIRLYPDYVDAIEVFNGGNATTTENTRAEQYAAQHAFPATSGSDSHGCNASYSGGIVVTTPFRSVDDYIAILTSGQGYSLITPAVAGSTAQG